MARFEDYANRNQALDTEIDESREASEQRRESQSNGWEMPERFRGKAPEEIAKSYTELENVLSRQANELGAQRKVINEILAMEARRASQGQSERKPVTVDELYDNPDEVVRRIVQEESASRLEALENELRNERIKNRKSDLNSRYPNWESVVRSPEFVNWASASTYRLRLAEQADSFDFDAADTLLGLYYDTQSAVQRGAEQERSLRNATLESGSQSTVSDSATRYSRTELVEKRLAAKRGDHKAQRWLDVRANDIRSAYEEGRIVD